LDHQNRIDNILTAMAEAGLDILFAFSPAAHHVDYGDAVALISGFKPMGASCAILKCDGDSVLIITPDWDLARAEVISQTDRVMATVDLAKTFAAIFASGLPASERIGVVDLHKMTHGTVAAITAITGAECRDYTDELFNLAARKTDEEIANARQATEIGERTYRHMLEIAEPGIPECQLAADMKCYSRSIGADDNFMMFHAEGYPLAVQPSGERKLKKGDLILAEITPSYLGQFSQVCRTASLGAPTDECIEKYELVSGAMEYGIKAARPGSPMKDICFGIDEILYDAGYGKYCEPPFMNRRGHGLGLTSTAPGNVSLMNETILEEDMFFVVHPNQYIPETGYFLCGEPILISEPDAEILTTSRAQLGVIDL